MRAVRAVVLSFGVWGCAQAQAADLLDMYREALVHDPQYASARAGYLASAEKENQGRAGLLPVIGVGGAWSRHASSDLLPAYNMDTYSAKLTQPVFNWANWQNFELGKLQSSIDEAKFAQAGQDLILRVAQAYFDVLEAEDVLAVTLAQKDAIEQQLASAKRNFEIGTQTIVDTHKAQSRYDLIVAQELANRNDLEIRRSVPARISWTLFCDQAAAFR